VVEILRYRSVYVIEHSCILDLQLSAKINPATGCAGRANKEEEREGYATKCANRTICFHLLYQETQFCRRSPRERVNHVNIVVLCG
jgi:hypothetical protein